jgi:uncharacterized protein (DUF2147 family)
VAKHQRLAERLERLARNLSASRKRNVTGLKPMLRIAVALAAALMLTMSPVAAKENLGVYQTSDRKMDFQLMTCGSGKDLCVKLLKARGSAATKQVKPYIGKLVIKNAKPAGENIWKGVMRFGKYDLNGSMTLKPGKSFYISGCVYLVVCDDITLIPAK